MLTTASCQRSGEPRTAEGKILGYGVVDRWEDHDHLLSIAVSREHRRRGIGQRLLSALEATLGNRSMRLEVRKGNIGAIQFYLKNGFTETGVEEGYYRDCEDAWLMESEPKPKPGA